ncbi:hypothetical protein E4M02_10565 [Brevundimonas sp. S30B]|uniref:AbiU2 domain-containing protein n=1 Tax=unclassified Brevundimonas TaxID=2622653 RepID=UPI0010729E7F|nr:MULTISPECIES: hypothetical protein [unclassified Brevundimonas]QBX38152.1 hypothetical protein E4M01_10490 [Brevundimonas sp. MF30-B]TFW01712.1 hypothetical protein E4M02_10565 [Brevundimonas sp. S30B]
MAREPAHDPGEAIDRLRHSTRRILNAIRWARAVNAVWRTFNRHQARQEIADSPASPAAHVYERTTLDAQIMMIARVFDAPGRGHILTQNRMSFPVCRTLMEQPGVMEFLLDQSEDWNELGAENRERLSARYHVFLDVLTALENEEPNRVTLVRGFRDENIAHELRFDVLPERPQYDHIHGLVDEASVLIGHLMLIVEGAAIHWQDGDVDGSVTWLWNAVADVSRRGD